MRDQHGLEAIDVPATYHMGTPRPCQTLLMPVYRIRHHGLECYLKTDFDLLPPNWFLSICTSQLLAQTYGLFDPARDWRHEPRYLDGFPEEWRYPPFAESPTRFTCAVDGEMDVYMLLRLLIGTPGPGHHDALLRRYYCHPVMKMMLPRIPLGQAFTAYGSSAVPQETVFTVVLDNGVAGVPPVIVDLFQRQHGKEPAQAFCSIPLPKSIDGRVKRHAGSYHHISTITRLP